MCGAGRFAPWFALSPEKLPAPHAIAARMNPIVSRSLVSISMILTRRARTPRPPLARQCGQAAGEVCHPHSRPRRQAALSPNRRQAARPCPEQSLPQQPASRVRARNDRSGVPRHFRRHVQLPHAPGRRGASPARDPRACGNPARAPVPASLPADACTSGDCYTERAPRLSCADCGARSRGRRAEASEGGALLLHGPAYVRQLEACSAAGEDAPSGKRRSTARSWRCGRPPRRCASAARGAALPRCGTLLALPGPPAARCRTTPCGHRRRRAPSAHDACRRLRLRSWATSRCGCRWSCGFCWSRAAWAAWSRRSWTSACCGPASCVRSSLQTCRTCAATTARPCP